MATGASWWNGLDKDTKVALIGAGASAAGGYFQNRAEDARHEEDRADSAITNRAEGIQAIQSGEKSDYEFGANRNDSNAVNAAKMSGSSPLEFQAHRAKMSALGDILGKGAGQHSFQGMPSNFAKHMPTGASMTPFSANTMNFFSPEAMANSEQNYWSAQNNIDPRLKGPDLGKVGYGPAGSTVSNDLGTERQERLDTRSKEEAAYQESAKARREALMAALNEMGPNGTGAEEDDGGIDWKKWGTLAAAGGAGYLGARYA